jgi:hypothetical protein
MKVSEFRKLIREEVRKMLKEDSITSPSQISGWVHAWSPIKKKYRMFPSATEAVKNGFTTVIPANDVEYVEPESLRSLTPDEWAADGWYDFKNNKFPTFD